MLGLRYPSALKRRLKATFRWQLRDALPDLIAPLMAVTHLIQHQPQADSYTLPAYPGPQTRHPSSYYPVPPMALWASYGTSPEEYLVTGQEDIEQMRAILTAAGHTLSLSQRVLEFGCAAGRLLRWLDDVARDGEVWGVDIDASAIRWCQEHLTPPFRFATTTVSPHLPFEDQAFDLIIAGSVFTHLEDLADAWLLELRRVLVPGGCLYLTLNDRSAVEIFEGAYTPEELARYQCRAGGRVVWERFITSTLHAAPGYAAFRRGSVHMLTIQRSVHSHVLWDADVFCARLAPWYRKLSIRPRAYGHQTGVLLARA